MNFLQTSVSGGECLPLQGREDLTTLPATGVEQFGFKLWKIARILAFFVSLTSCNTYRVRQISMILGTIRVGVTLNNH